MSVNFICKQNKYKIIKPLGKGTYGTVFLVEDEIKNKYAMKTINYLNETLMNSAINEILILKKLKSKYIIEIYDYIITELTIDIIMEYTPYGDLEKFINNNNNKIDEIIINRFIYQINEAIKELHINNIIHCDIKPSNILIFKNFTFKLADMGGCHITSNINEKIFKYNGTLSYMSPEMFNNNGYDYNCDYWAFGCTIYELLIKDKLFSSTNYFDLYNEICNKSINLNNKNINNIYKDLLKNIFINDIKLRYKYNEIFNFYTNYLYNPNNYSKIYSLFEQYYDIKHNLIQSPLKKPLISPNLDKDYFQLENDIKTELTKKKSFRLDEDNELILNTPKLSSSV